MIFKHITELIGNTPLLELDPKVHGLKNINLYAKLEFYNPFGSVKDRIAWGMIKDDIKEIQNKKLTIVEASSGNTAKALQALASVYGVQTKILTNRSKVLEVKKILQILGTTIEEFPGLSECPDPNAPNDVFTSIQRLVAANPDKFYYPSQYTNQKNISTHFETTGKEIQKDLGSVDYFFGGLGTTGSTRGTAEFLKKKNPLLETIGIVSGRSDFIPGIRTEDEMWDVGLFEKDFYKKIIAVDSKDAINATIKLMRHYGILAGPTSGAAYHATITYLSEIDPKLNKKHNAVFIVCDRIEWYISYLEKRIPELFGQKIGITLSDLSEKDLDSVIEIKPNKLKRLMNSGAILIDTRGNMAYKMGHIPHAINIRDDILLELTSADNLPFSKKSQIVLSCTRGNKSRQFAALLQKKGYVVFSLQGGFTRWLETNGEIEVSL